jgi:hypothetical protein
MRTHHASHFENVTQSVTRRGAQNTMPLLISLGLPVAGAFRIETHTLDHRKVRVMVPDWQMPDRGDCWPLREPRMVEDFAGISDEASLQEFNEQYGLLGFHLLHGYEMRRRRETWRGDPVPWALAHARIAAGILGATRIISDVRSGKVTLNDRSIGPILRALIGEFKKMGMESTFVAGPPRRWEGFTWTPPEGLVGRAKFQLRKRFTAFWKSDPIGTTYFVLAWVLNQYIRHIHLEFASIDYERRIFGLTASEPRFGLHLYWHTLLPVIYWQLGERLGGAFRQCRRCGKIFPMRAGKDLFCGRRCGNASRSKAYRDKKKRGKRRKRRKRRR